MSYISREEKLWGLGVAVRCNCFEKGKSRANRVIIRGCIDVMREETKDLIQLHKFCVLSVP